MKRILLVGAFLVVGAGLAACGDDDAREVLTVQVDGGTMSVSGDPSSGAVDVEINGDLEEGTEVDFTRVSEGTSAEDFLAGLSSILEGGPFADFLLSNAGVAAGGSSTPSVTLEPGSYFVWVETDNDGIVYTPLTVDGDGGDADLPDTDGAFTTKDYGFTVDAKAGDTYTIVNDGSQFHHVVMFDFGDLDPEIVKENLPAFFAAEEDDPPPEAFAEVDLANLDVGGSGVFGPGGSGTFEVTLEEGTTYAVVCFIQDRAGGPPHAFAHDMYDVFTVT